MIALRVVLHATELLARTTPPGDPLGPTSQDPDGVRDAACKLVAGESTCTPPPAPDVTSGSPSRSSGGGGGGFSFLGGLLWLLLIVVAVALIYVLYRFIADRQSEARKSSTTDDGDNDPDDDELVGTVIIDRSREPRGWREEAETHRSAGRHRDALRCRYRALVGDLARRGLLDEIPGRTTGEERRQLRVSAPSAVPAFREAADLFDGAWYGNAPVDATHDDRFQQLDQIVLDNATPMPHRVPRRYEVGV